MSNFTGIMAEIEESIGLNGALLLAQRYGGQRVYVPNINHINEGHPLSLAIGIDSAKTLCENFYGEALEIPNKGAWRDMRNDLIRQLYVHEGYTADQCAAMTGMTRRNIFNILKSGSPGGGTSAAADSHENQQSLVF